MLHKQAMERTHILVLFSLLQAFVGQPVNGDSYFSLPAEIQALQGSCVVLPCNSSSVFQDSFHSPIFKWCLWRRIINNYPEVYNNMDSRGVEPRFKGRTFFVGNLKQNNCSLQINNVTADDDDEYYPLIESRYDQTVRVKVSDLPEEPTISRHSLIIEGHSVMINCSVVHTCPPHPPTLAWDHLQGNTIIYHEDLHDGRWRTVLMLNYTPTERVREKSFTCSATHSNGKMSHVYRFFLIRYAPKEVTVAVLTGNGIVGEGDTVTLNCSCRGYPSIMTYRWFEGLQKVQLQNDKHNSVITLRNIGWDSGPYMCTAENSVGTGESVLLYLNIEYAPKGTQIASVNNVTEGEQLVLSCETKSSKPAVTYYTWYMNNTEMEKQKEKTLKIERTTKHDSGSYQCVAHNKIGNGSSEMRFINVNSAETTAAIFVILSVSAGVIILLLGLLVFLFIRSRRKRLPLQAKDKQSHSAAGNNPQFERTEEIPMKEQLYGNIQEYLHVTDEYPGSSRSKYPEPTDHEDMKSEKVYSEIKRLEQQEQENPEELHYSTIHQFPRHATPHVDTQPDDFVEYAAVQH